MQRRAGLAQRLDYLQELGTNGIWLLPLYPSPLRDDGFDVADYETFDRPRLERP
jgi:maltose alpha-D-glucosyltransferase/alpha-amylase